MYNVSNSVTREFLTDFYPLRNEIVIIPRRVSRERIRNGFARVSQESVAKKNRDDKIFYQRHAFEIQFSSTPGDRNNEMIFFCFLKLKKDIFGKN